MHDTIETYSKQNPRIYALYWVFSALFVILFIALGYRQIFLYDNYAAASERQTQRRVIKPGARGEIFDRNGRILVANRPLFSAVVYMDEIRREHSDERARLRKIVLASAGRVKWVEIWEAAWHNVFDRHMDNVNKILGTNYEFDFEEFKKNYSNTLLPVPLIKNLTSQEHAILAERLSVNSSVKIYTDTARYYPYRDRAAHAIGYVKNAVEEVDENIPGEGLRTFAFVGKKGASGMEKAFEKTLAGRFGTEIWLVDSSVSRYDNLLKILPEKGEDVYSSLDIEIQDAADKGLEGLRGAAVVLDVKSGEILAMSSKPSYDLNLLSPYIPTAVYNDIYERGAESNLATQALYPPGSTFKIVTAIAGLENGAITPESRSQCTGSVKIGGIVKRCNSRYGHGWVDLNDAIAKSCNVFFYEYGIKTGIDAISAAGKSFGLNSDPGVEIGSAYRGTVVPNPEYKKSRKEGPWSAGDTANVAIGQGYLLQTPIQMACFAASIARGETRTKASILHDSTRNPDMAYHGAQKIPLSQAHYEAVIKGMENAVIYGTAKHAAVDGVRVAAKSGTAQFTDNGKKINLAWMIAFAPVENPKVAMAVVVQGEEVGDVSGGGTAGPIAGRILQKYFALYGDTASD